MITTRIRVEARVRVRVRVRVGLPESDLAETLVRATLTLQMVRATVTLTLPMVRATLTLTLQMGLQRGTQRRQWSEQRAPPPAHISEYGPGARASVMVLG